MQNLNKTVIFSSFYILGIIGFLTGATPYIGAVLLILTIWALLKDKITCKGAVIYYLMFALALVNCNYRIKNHDDLSKFLPSKAVVSGTVLSIPTTNNPERTKFFLKADSGVFDGVKAENLKAQTIVTIYDTKENLAKLKIADKVKLEGKLRSPLKATNPSQFDYANYLKNHNTFSTLHVKNSDWSIEGRPENFGGRFLQKLNDKRIKILNTQKKYIKSPNIEVLGGIVFGDDAINPPDHIKNSFINSGLLHILAASGMNVSIIFGLWYFIGTRLRLNRRFVVGFGALLVAFYTLMTGMGPSVLRAAIMIEFIILGKLIDRSTNSISLIFAAAFLMLVYDPRMINDVGFQLSFIVTFALIFYSEPVLGKINNKIAETCAGAVFIPLVAQLWAAPIQMFYFNTFATYSVFANFAIAPFIVVISFTGFLCSILAMIPIQSFSEKVCEIFAFILNPVVTVLVRISDFFSELPYSLLTTIHPDIVQIILYYTILVVFGFILRDRFKNKKLIGSIVVLCIVFAFSFIKFEKKELEIVVFDVGNADSFLIKTPYRKYIMIDTAHGKYPGTKSGFSQAEAIMNKYLKDRGIKTLDVLILTHFDSDHSGGAVDVMSAVKVKKLVLSKEKDNSKTTKGILKYVKEKGINTVEARNNETVIEEENLKLTTFTPDFAQDKNDNDNSTLALLSYGDFDMLFMADGGVRSFNKIKEDLKNDNVEVLKSGHHGARNTVTTKMIKTISPDAAIISTGFNTYGHPTKETLKTFSKNKVKVYRTDTSNAVKITSDGKIYKIHRYDSAARKFVKDSEKPCRTAGALSGK